MESWLFGVRDGNLEIEKSGEVVYLGVIGSFEVEANDFAAGGRVSGGVDGVGAPLDEKREKAGLIVLEIESLPLEEAAVGTLARAGIGAVESDVCIAKASRKLVQVAGMSGPANEARLDDLRQALVVWGVGLQRIERNDFEIVPFTKRDESVARAASGMNATECGADAGVFFDEGNAEIEIVAAEEDVVEHGGRSFFFGGKQRAGTGNGRRKEY